MNERYDVIIAGGGPAGLVTAQTIAERGFSVLLVEQKKEITRVYRSCCCNLIVEAGTHRETVCYRDGRLHFAENGFSVPYSGTVIDLTRSIKVSPGGRTLTIQGGSPEGAAAVSIEKEVLLQDLLGCLRDKNVTIMNETSVLGVENTSEGVVVTLRSRSGEATVAGRIAVAADGVNSRMVQSLGLNKSRRTFFARFGVASAHLEGVDCPYPQAWITFVGKGHTLGGRGQLYLCPKPHGGKTDPPVYELTVGLPIPPKPGEGRLPRDELEHFIAAGPFADWFKHARVCDRRAALLNFYTPLVNPLEGNVVVVGDAAAFIETYVQGAVMYGFQAGNAVADYLSTGTGLERYAQSWAESFEYNDPEEIKAATQAFGLHVLEDDELDYFFSLTGRDTIKGFVNEFSDPDTVNRTIDRHLEQITRERPALGAKLAGFRDTSVEDALQVGNS